MGSYLEGEHVSRVPSKPMHHGEPNCNEGTSSRTPSKRRSSSKASLDTGPAVPSISPDEALMNQIEGLYPADEYEMTMFATLPRLRPGESIILQDFKEKKAMNNMKGKCLDCDTKFHVWTLLLANGQAIRVVPHSIHKAIMVKKNAKDNVALSKPVDGFITYGTDIVQVILDADNVNLRRHVKEHVVIPDKEK